MTDMYWFWTFIGFGGGVFLILSGIGIVMYNRKGQR